MKYSAFLFFLASTLMASNSMASSSNFPEDNKIPTCKTAPAGLDNFRIEHAVDVPAIMSGLTPHIPDNISTEIFVNGKEVRSRITYDRMTKILQNDLFLVEKGASLPTSDDTDFKSVRFAYITVKADKIYLSCKPYATVMVTGKTTAGFPIYAPPAGAPYSFAFGYDVNKTGDENDGSSIREVVSLSSGIALLYTKEAVGKVSFMSKAK